MTTDLRSWLDQNGLGQHADRLVEQEIDLTVLPDLTDDHLKELGLPLGARMKILKAAQNLALHPGLAEEPATAVSVPPQAERRQLTVMFVDLVSSTELSSKLDPEDMRTVLTSYQNTAAGIITRYEGFVAKYMGDGVLAYFGWPRAHEDEAERAVRAGLEITQAVAALKSPDDTPLACRIGIATGLVVVGDMIGEGAAQEQAVVGETPNLAARLQALAEPGDVIISTLTRHLLGAAFEADDIGPQRLKGLDPSLRAHRIITEKPVGSRFEARGGALHPMVGRDQEIALLMERWRLTKTGEGKAVLLIGEAGIGKSRLTRALLDAIAAEPHTRIRYQCSPYHTESALWPVSTQLRQAAGFAEADNDDERLDNLESLLAQAGDASCTLLIAALLELDGSQRYGVLDLTPAAQRARTLQALIDQLLGLCRRNPVIVVLEDAHWIDPSTLELIVHALNRIADARVMLLISSRPDNPPELGNHTPVTRLTLDRLGRAGMEAIVEHAGGSELPVETIAAIVARTDGVPLYVEELTKVVVEGGEATVPATLHDTLMARLDRFPEAKEVAQIAAAIGREFSHRLLAFVAGRSESDLAALLKKLADAELIFCHGISPDANYSFKHALVRDIAYQSLLKPKRQQLHSSIYKAMEQRVSSSRPEVMAQHAHDAGMTDLAIDLYIEAGEQAIRQSALIEAASNLRAGLQALKASVEEDAKPARELRIQAGLARALAASDGYSAKATGAAFERAIHLCQELADHETLLSMLYGKFMFHLNRGNIEAAHLTALEQLALSEQYQNEQAQLIGVRALGTTTMWRGDYQEALVLQNRALKLFDHQRDRRELGSFSHDPLVSILSNLAWILLPLGFPDQALAKSEAAVAEARRLGHPVSMAVALHRSCQFRHLAGDIFSVRARVDELRQLADTHNLPFFRAFSLAFGGLLELSEGNADTAIQTLRDGVAFFGQTNQTLLRPYLNCLLAEGLASAHQGFAALTIIDDALAETERSPARWLESELCRRRANILLAADRKTEAEKALERAIQVAKSQHALFWEFRAAKSLARIWSGNGQQHRARDLLSSIYSRFTEGFDTPELIEAKELLDVLS